MWRQKDWAEVINKRYPDMEQDAEERRAVNDFEAGADAILDALIKKTGRFTLDHETTYVSEDGAFSGVILEPGWEVFILNKEVNDGTEL